MHLQKEEPFSSDPYFSILFSKFLSKISKNKSGIFQKTQEIDDEENFQNSLKIADWNKNDQNALEWSGPGNKMEAFETSS